MHASRPLDSNDLHPAITDLQAIDEVNRGNREMFEVLVRRYNRQLYRIGFSYLRHHDQTEDAMQNTYLKAFVHLGNFQRQASFSTWLTRIMINECLMLLRRRDRHDEVPVADADDEDTTAPQGATRMHLKEMKAQLEQAISALPRNLRTVYVLREIQQMTTEETAACLRISPGSVKVNLHRARERLKATLLANAAILELFPYRAEFCDPFTARVMHAVLQG
ncbi:MAG TPA: sigma-70 family RNA polymerase sigma factor [Lacunisphaera sp.]|nr:sigma-70 family RNA polymerase sigma factor [Lacunisphaera sp.]